MKRTIIAACLVALAGPCLAQEGVRPQAASAGPVPMPKVERPERPKAPRYDMSRPVTLTGAELQAYVRAAVLQAQAAAAAQAAAETDQKISAAMSVPEDAPAAPVEPTPPAEPAK